MNTRRSISATNSALTRVLVFALALGALAFGVIAVDAQGPVPRGARAPKASLIVTTLNDLSSIDGVCSLREAITAANNNADYLDCAGTTYGDDVITFAVSGTITLTSNLPAISAAGGALTIDGANGITISGNNLYRPFYIDTSAQVTLQNLTVANGYLDAGFLGGAGIHNYGGVLTITNSTLVGNTAAQNGGALFNDTGAVTRISNSTLISNTANTEAGGAIYTRAGSNLTVWNSVFISNTALNNYGGAIYAFSNAATTISNTTFARNAAQWGGGIMLFGSPVTITHSTFAENSATSFGGAIRFSSGSLNVSNSILANSLAGGNCSGAPTNGGNNLDSGATCGWGSVNGSMSNTDPLLMPLANYGGATQTFMLQLNSPAIDGVTFNAPNGCPATDQRGITRPQDVRCDIGAVEMVPYIYYMPVILKNP